ncbi:putative Ubiquitin-like domain superfamily [Helianthus annuus]|uniref:Putative autophagy-related protein 11, Ubiquitin-related domain protein n=1 Tax=Helianthus annuus TaxID=4232 RepID=A0A251UQ43_HELAN|nr:autophagy-related protein 11 [Helianthus annuus]XP_022037827.1 autophagy-related protein 11 [Helianthus annuus]XP_035846466.1 autophagy-related protein 11 [Helianthus annuus]KAF5804894.1 putative Ubiquitin-like domain superfamily [Helianthus annuus]KAJ0569464.1 putative Ubiquitin-like domain superfamily [Helianthus annuus]KAJ0583771.1 putative Ubiquitin-like domain superfamily [Helianthus annuus]KAJ0917998.1 putative Ubiquitin-like domain superfamily [Helianthus annuus]
MSSSSGVSEGVVQRGKLLVHVAENGRSFELNCDEYTLVESVQRYLETLSGIQLNDQLLLYLDLKLEPQQPLSAYKLPLEDREVFLYNKSRMRSNSTPPQPEEIESLETINPDPPLPSSSNDPHPLDDASDPALKVLPLYERQFRYNCQLADAIYQRTLLKLETCERLSREQRVQEKALEIARGNLDHIYKMILRNYSDFVKRYSHQQRSHSNLLVNFWRDLERLRSVKLIPALQSDNRKCLSDFVKEGNLRKMVEDCSNSHRQFESKVEDFKEEFKELKGSTEHLFSSEALINNKVFERTIKEHRQYIDDQKSIMQALSKDISMVKKLVDDCLTSQPSNSLRPHDAVSALGPMYEGHEKNYIPKMRACEGAISNLLMFCKDKKSEMIGFVHGYMQKIAYIQYTIRDVRYKFSVFNEAINRQNDQFEQLKVVRGIGPAYRACLAEIVRRKASMKLYMGMAGQLAEKLASKRESEVRKREEFIKVHSLYIPHDILSLMGLYDTPSVCDVNVAPFDRNLLDLDIPDLDRFAPERNNESEDIIELGDIVGTNKLEVENAKLKAELASVTARLCFSPLEIEFEYFDEGKMDILLKEGAEKTNEALRLKDEYVKQLESVLNDKQMQCGSYEKRIEELERRLSDRYSLEHKIDKDDSFTTGKVGDSKSETSSERDVQGHSGQFSEPMDDALYGYSSLVSKSCVDKTSKILDDNMTDSSGMANPNPNLDSSMREPSRDVNEKDENEETVPDVGMQNILEEKSNQLTELEAKLEAAKDEVATLARDLEISRNLLDESQVNCVHLEKCLHEARKEARTHLCAANSKASDYNKLRGSTLKIRSLFERLKSSVSSADVSSFADSLQSLSQSLTNSANDGGDDGTAEFRECVHMLAKKVGILARHRAELVDRYTKAEAAQQQLTKELDESKALVNTLYLKHQSEKQANKEKISIGRLELHEIAAFVLNTAGYYTAINRNCSHYYLSPESAALYADSVPHNPTCIVGQIVHIERQTVKPSPPVQTDHNGASSQSGLIPGPTDANPYGLAVGCEFFVVTVAMLPDTAVHTPPPPAAAS